MWGYTPSTMVVNNPLIRPYFPGEGVWHWGVTLRFPWLEEGPTSFRDVGKHEKYKHLLHVQIHLYIFLKIHIPVTTSKNLPKYPLKKRRLKWLRVFFHDVRLQIRPKQRGRSSVRTLAGGGRCPHRHLWRDPKGRNNPKAPLFWNDRKKLGMKTVGPKLEEVCKKNDNMLVILEVVKNIL